jgi:hypothetical protein
LRRAGMRATKHQGGGQQDTSHVLKMALRAATR